MLHPGITTPPPLIPGTAKGIVLIQDGGLFTIPFVAQGSGAYVTATGADGNILLQSFSLELSYCFPVASFEANGFARSTLAAYIGGALMGQFPLAESAMSISYVPAGAAVRQSFHLIEPIDLRNLPLDTLSIGVSTFPTGAQAITMNIDGFYALYGFRSV